MFSLWPWRAAPPSNLGLTGSDARLMPTPRRSGKCLRAVALVGQWPRGSGSRCLLCRRSTSLGPRPRTDECSRATSRSFRAEQGPCSRRGDARATTKAGLVDHRRAGPTVTPARLKQPRQGGGRSAREEPPHGRVLRGRVSRQTGHVPWFRIGPTCASHMATGVAHEARRARFSSASPVVVRPQS